MDPSHRTRDSALTGIVSSGNRGFRGNDLCPSNGPIELAQLARIPNLVVWDSMYCFCCCSGGFQGHGVALQEIPTMDEISLHTNGLTTVTESYCAPEARSSL